MCPAADIREERLEVRNENKGEREGKEEVRHGRKREKRRRIELEEEEIEEGDGKEETRRGGMLK